MRSIEVYVPGGGSSADSAATKSWLTEVVPEMHLKSASDICLGVRIIPKLSPLRCSALKLCLPALSLSRHFRLMAAVFDLDFASYFTNKQQEGVICVILMDPNGKPKKEQIDMLKTLHDQYDRKINRGFDFKYMWLNGQIEKEWVNYF